MMSITVLIQVIVTLLLNFHSSVRTQSTCGPKVSARLLMDIPCDMSKTNFCELSGTVYPWAAVRRYIYENQGLLRRMYGDQRHYSIVTNEIREVKDKYDNVFIFDKETQFYDGNQINQQSPYAVKYQPQFRPRAFFMDESDEDQSVTHSSLSSPSSTSQSTMTTNSQPANSSEHNLNFNNQSTNINNETLNKTFSPSENNQESSTIASKSSSSLSTSSSTSTINDQSASSESDYSDSGATIRSDDGPTESPSDQENEMTKVDKLLYSIETNLQLESSESSSSSQSTPQASSPSFTSSTPPPSTTTQSPLTNFGTKTTPLSTIEPLSPSSHPNTDTNSEINNNPNNQPPPPVPPKQPTAPVEPDPTPKGKGVNACPVKEEVIAPYWANNTRGEILALLNVYPFEQYVHWEKCAHENSQMFCRDGCRCEQQYRLHRLLAFDPKNECRGIFADWFRFPSCCVCICYDLPESNLFYRSNKRKSRL